MALVIALAVGAGRASAQERGGFVVSILGVMEVQTPESETWEPVRVGTSLGIATRLRTKAASAARIVLTDGSAVELAAATEISIERIAAEAEKQRYVSLLRLDDGRLHALVDQKYGVAGSRFEVETPTAVAASHAGAFVVQYDRDSLTTTVVGLDQDVSVQGAVGLIGAGVTVGPHAYTTVQQGRLPSPAAPAGVQELVGYRKGLTVLGTGDPDEGVGHGHPAFAAQVLRPEDLPPLAAGQAAAESVVVKPSFPDAERPGTFLAERLSPDFGVHEQPIPEFEAARPGDRPVGGVQVDF
jgi:hypothetical protein